MSPLFHVPGELGLRHPLFPRSTGSLQQMGEGGEEGAGRLLFFLSQAKPSSPGREKSDSDTPPPQWGQARGMDGAGGAVSQGSETDSRCTFTSRMQMQTFGASRKSSATSGPQALSSRSPS